MSAELMRALKPLQGDLEQVTDRLMDALHHPVARAAAKLITAGGKRLRPILVLLAGRSGAYRRRRAALIDLAAAVELVHTATLIHDDIIDSSDTRRTQPTLHRQVGIERAVLLGDYLYAAAFSILARLRPPHVMAYMAESCQQLSRGEILEVHHRYNVELTEADYFEIVRDKTASLIAACCHVGAALTGASASTVRQVTDFGWNVGMAFQIVDDCLDLTGEEQTVGKPLRADLEKGALSLPMVYLAQSLPAVQRDKLFAPLRRRAVDRFFFSRVARAARQHGVIERAMQTARTFVERAESAVAVRNGLMWPQVYRDVARYAIERVQ
jgi:geranylgeranyl pyrophosphate synthase